MEKEKERAKVSGVIQAEPLTAEIVEDLQKERRTFQLQMCEVRKPGGGAPPACWLLVLGALAVGIM